MALERARLAYAQIEAWAPLNGLIDNQRHELKPLGEANVRPRTKKRLPSSLFANSCIEKFNYHRRDAELAELYSVMRGERTFSSLAPRV